MKTTLRISFVALLVMIVNLSIAQIRIVAYAPAAKAIAFKNFGSTAQDISSLRFCHKFSYGTLGALPVLVGSLTDLQPGDSVVVSRASLATSSDFGLYEAGVSSSDFGNSAKMLDFIQFGSGGNGRESVAVTKGIWNAGDFLTGTETHVLAGGATEFGLNFFMVVTNVNDFKVSKKFSVYPNPATAGDNLSVDLPSFEQEDLSSVTYVNQQGITVYKGTSLETPENLNIGVYSLIVNTKNGNQYISRIQIQ